MVPLQYGAPDAEPRSQIAASFASFGAMSITVKAGSAAAALAGSRWFVPLVSVAASADAVQLVALTDITLVELNKIQNGAGTPEDKQRAVAVLLTQLIVTGGLTALSVQGARNVRALLGTAAGDRRPERREGPARGG